MTEKSEHIIRREHYVAGREDERECIIELLESECECQQWEFTPSQVICAPHRMVALIKANNNG